MLGALEDAVALQAGGVAEAGVEQLLELDAELGERLDDDGDEDVLDEPGEEEDHGDEVEVGAPGRQAVGGAVHEEDPALLGGRLVHREYAHDWRWQREKKKKKKKLHQDKNIIFDENQKKL